MSHPNGEQADPFHTPATSQPPYSFQESAAQFTAAAPAATAPAVPETAPSVDPATQPVYTSGAATVPAVPAAPPVPAAPAAPAVPGYAPASAPVPAPVSAPGYAAGYAPGYAADSGTSAYPVTGVPVSGYPMVMEPKKKRTGMIVLTVATIVLGLATAGLGTMYLLENGKRTQADTKVSEQTAQLDAADKKIKEIESKLATSKEENAKLTQDLTGAKNKTDEVTKARDAMAACFQAINEYARNRNANTAKDADTKCAEASKYY